MSVITLEKKILKKNDEIAKEIKNILKNKNIFSINILSSPGSGKTSLLEKTIDFLHNNLRIAVIEGDIQTDIDAQRIAKHNVPAIQIVTHGTCHLEANLVKECIDKLNLDELDLIVIENVGNLICPSSYDLGENLKVVVISTTEGDDKPLKYPAIFRGSSIMVINKIDLLPYVPFNLEKVKTNALSINPNLLIFEISCTTDAGIENWCNWLKENCSNCK
jgi:hydrogenase nickel incorporation protein HypB